MRALRDELGLNRIRTPIESTTDWAVCLMDSILLYMLRVCVFTGNADQDGPVYSGLIYHPHIPRPSMLHCRAHCRRSMTSTGQSSPSSLLQRAPSLPHRRSGDRRLGHVTRQPETQVLRHPPCSTFRLDARRHTPHGKDARIISPYPTCPPLPGCPTLQQAPQRPTLSKETSSCSRSRMISASLFSYPETGALHWL